MNFATSAAVVTMPGAADRKVSVDDMLHERQKMQEQLVKAYPDIPMITRDNVRTYTDYAYAAHDQAVFLFEAMNEIKSMHESHFMTKKNKELIRDKKALEDELHLAKSMGPADGKAAVN